MPTSTAYLYPNEVTADSGAWALTGAATKWEAIDDPQGLPDDDASYLECTTSLAGVEQIAFGFQSMPEAVSIISVDVEFRSKKTSGSGNQQTFINGGSVAGHTLDVVYTDYADAFANDPLTGLPWSKAGVDAATVTMVQDATVMTARLTAMRLKVVFVASAAKIGAAREVGSRIVRAFRRPVGQLAIRGPLLWADMELLTDFAFSSSFYPDAQGSGAGQEQWQRAMLRCLSSSIDLDSMSVSLLGLDLRQYLVRFWDTAISEEPANATAPGAARLDSGVGRTFTRASKAWVQNAAVAPQGSVQLIEIGADVEKAEPLGLLIEEARTNDILNSAFALGSFTSWTSTGNVVADGGDLLFDPSVSAQTCALQRIGTGNSNISHGGLAYNGEEVLTLSVWHRDDSNTSLTWTLVRSTDSWFWNDTTEGWQAGSVLNTLAVRLANFTMDQSKPIVLSIGAQSLTLTLFAETISGQLNHIGHVQLEAGYHATSSVVTEGAPVTREAELLEVENFGPIGESWPIEQGTAGGTFTPEYSTNANLPDSVLLDVTEEGDGFAWDRVLYRNSTGEMVFQRNDGDNTFEAVKSVTLTLGVSVRVAARWTGPAMEFGLPQNTMSIFVDGFKGTDVVADTGAMGGSALRIGWKQDTDDPEDFANGNVSHITVVPFVLADEEIPDWL